MNTDSDKATYQAILVGLDYQHFKKECPEASEEMLMFLISQATQIRLNEKQR